VGKTSLLSAAINGDTDQDYASTRHSEVYYDVGRRLELIDTPGVEDYVLDGTFKNFQSDPLVKSIVHEQKDDKLNLLAGAGDTNTIDAYVIVFTNERRSQHLARAIRRAIRCINNDNIRDNPIYLLWNRTDMDRGKLDSEKEAEYEKLVILANQRNIIEEDGRSYAEIENEKKRREEDLENEHGGRENLAHLRHIFSNEDIENEKQMHEKDMGVWKTRSKTGWKMDTFLNELEKLNESKPKRYRNEKKIDDRTNCRIPGCSIS